jgi:hypothetical protein
LIALLGFVGILCSIPCTVMAYVHYFRRPDASWFGFGFARYYYGDFRREHLLLFAGSLGGVLVGIVCNFVGSALMGAGH